MKRERETLTGRIEVEVKLTYPHIHVHLNTYKYTQTTFILAEMRNSTRSDTLKSWTKVEKKVKLNTLKNS